RPIPCSLMAPGGAHPALVSAWLLFLFTHVAAPPPEPYYMQVVQSCELDEASGAVQAVTRYALNGEDVLQYHGDQNRWFSVHPAAWRMAERWNREREMLAGINAHTPQQCRTFIRITSPFTAQTTAQPTVHVSLVRGTRGQPRRLMCHVTGFYPRDIEVTWEREGRGALGEQMTSRIRPNGDPTFQIQVSIELGLGEHVCVVRHVSLGGAPLRITWGESHWRGHICGTCSGIGSGALWAAIPACK
uniref:Ig-like domain-containing protein n=1 Tax=Chrysemys picta bellii TaxID=8478 RepID=A0A8C3FR75_CHRPI